MSPPVPERLVNLGSEWVSILEVEGWGNAEGLGGRGWLVNLS